MCSGTSRDLNEATGTMALAPRLVRVAVVIAWICLLISAVLGSTQDQWVQWALQRQFELQVGLPLNCVVLAATHGSFNAADDGYFDQPHLAASGQTLFAQKLSLAKQLEFGVRRLFLEVHLVAGEARVCRGGGAIQTMCDVAAANTPSGAAPICEAALGFEDLGSSTGCTSTDSTLSEILAIICTFLVSAAGQHAVLMLRLEDRSGGDVSVGATVAAAVGDLVYRPSDKSQTEWPSIAALRALGRRVVIETDSTAAWVSSDAFPIASQPAAPHSYACWLQLQLGFIVLTVDAWVCAAPSQAKNVQGLPSCGFTESGTSTDLRTLPFPAVTESRLQVDLCTLISDHSDVDVVGRSSSVCGSNFKSQYRIRGLDTTGALTSDKVQQLAACDVTVALELATTSRLRDTVWSWAEGAGLVGGDQGAVMAAASSGRWMQADKASVRAVACRATTNVDNTLLWNIDPTLHTFAAASTACAVNYEFAAPRSALENRLLLNELRREAVSNVWVAATANPGASSGAGSRWAPLTGLLVAGVAITVAAFLAVPPTL